MTDLITIPDAEPKEPAILYHYTTVDAMMNIVKPGEIWATGIHADESIRRSVMRTNIA